MNILRREWFDVSRADTFRIVPLGDVHLGNAACDEKLFKAAIDSIAADDNAYWIGMGDYADWINRKDPRHRESRLAPWLHGRDDLAMHQRQRVVETFQPIRDKCLALVKGNHEDTILKHSEVDVYYRLVEEMKTSTDHQLALGVQGFLVLVLNRGGEHKNRRQVTF